MDFTQKKNQIWFFHLTTSKWHTRTCCTCSHGDTFLLFQFLTSSSRITADWTRSESRDASGPPSPVPSWRSWSGFLLKHTTRTSTPGKSWLSKSIWLKPECRYAASSSIYACWRHTNCALTHLERSRFKTAFQTTPFSFPFLLLFT